MFKLFATMFVSAAALFISQCSSERAVNQVDPATTKSVTVAIVIPDSIAPLIATANCRVSAPDMRTIDEKLSYTAPYLYGTIPDIPCGTRRLFSVEVVNHSGSIEYTGEAYADIFPAETTVVKIILRKPGGTAIIEGGIEDNDTIGEIIEAPIRPAIDFYEVDDSGVILHLITTPCASSLGHEVVYSWSLLHTNGTWVGTKSFAPICSMSVEEDGVWGASVKVICASHSEVFSYSDTLHFTKTGNIILPGSNPDKDITPPVIYKAWDDTLDTFTGDTIILDKYTAIDDHDGDITSDVIVESDVLWHKVGQYTYTLISIDAAGNVSTDQTVIAVRKK